ncbi:DUF3429 domain-containing protein [Roseibacterium sp. SDUM158017]|uniref:DUF3429 domain-containing protein n=1 Tax=Roseicyclus salinarum TaxID=3036773 RepID=UPI002414F3C2|nr:DUF3429 domain-containing protein [Roseibacterium sp. SDUM158017]MDG4649025.1 DUF3429 domain-containing protein [Roseibacterium sp. SDUM158017]
MTRIPAAPLLLGLAGLIPFLWGAATSLSPSLAAAASGLLPGRFIGGVVLQIYGMIILSFMAGVIWGYGTRAEAGRAGLFYALSVLPPIWAFFAASGATGPSLAALIAGFVALLSIDLTAVRAGLAPAWWMSLRLLLTAVVAICLALGFVGA